MGRLRLPGLGLAAVLFLCIPGCGGHSSPGVSPYPVRVTLNPGTSASVDLGAIFIFTATAQNSSNNNVSTTFTFQSSDTTVLNLAPNGVACAGHWDAVYTVCTPGGTGVALVTASAFGATSSPTYVFVHPPIDNITVSGVLLSGVPVQEPCLGQGQSMTVQARAFSQGIEVTASVGPFTWSVDNAAVVKITPLVTATGSPIYPFATNQATATASTPGIAQIFATASGVTSKSFLQPQYQNAQGVTSPPLDFFETCLIQNITLELGQPGSQQTGQTTFVSSKGTTQPSSAVVYDVIGNNSLPNSNAPVVLSKIPLTWTSSQPSVLTVPSGCTLTCSLTTPSPGAGSVTASCSPPTCNIGYPTVPLTLSTPAALAACEQFFGIKTSCAAFIPAPVYATAAISGVVSGSTSAASVLASSSGCASVNPLDCTTSIYNVTTSKSVAGNPTPMPTSPNSLLFDLAGDKAYMGSEVAALAVNPTNIGTSSSPFSAIGTVTGKVLAVSNSGTLAIFSETQLLPNQVFIANTAPTTGAQSVTALNISNASAAAFSPDGVKAFIFGTDSTGAPNLYIYSTIQALQTIPLPANTAISAINFSPNGAFAFVSEVPTNGSTASPTLNALSLCNNQFLSANMPLPTSPAFMQVLPGPHMDGVDSGGNTFTDGIHVLLLDTTGFNVVTANVTPLILGTLPLPGTLCPQNFTFVAGTPSLPQPQRIELNQGTIQPIDFFPSADSTLLYVLARNLPTVLVYNFANHGTTGIQLVGNATPVSGSMSADAGTLVIAGSDGLLHEVTTGLGGTDLSSPLIFPNLPNYLNPFCTFTPASGPCPLDLVAVKP
jgi:hypothetical protein